MTMEAAPVLLRDNVLAELHAAPSLAWRMIGVRLCAASRPVRGVVRTNVRDHTHDAHARSGAPLGGTNLQRAA